MARPAAALAPAEARPRSVILMIPDGCGPATLDLARAVLGRPLALDSMLVGASRTGSASSRITDSAAGATALASGIKTNNAEIGEDAAGRPVGTVLEAAHARGMGVGLVATSRITHATPAAFAAHVPDRNTEDIIAVEELAARADVLLGGGREYFLPRRAGGGRRDGRDLLAEARRRGVHVIGSRRELLRAAAAPLVGLFASDHMSCEVDRDTVAEPSLAEMTRAALALLGSRPGGFFLMVEGSRIDHVAHDNDPGALPREVLAYDEAVRVAREFARRDGRTLVLSVADHETGGLGLGRREEGEHAVGFRPEALAGVRASAWSMAERIRAGADPESTLARGTGIRDLSAEERSRLDGAVARDASLEETLGGFESRRAGVGWTTGGHTALDVGLYAFGPGAERFAGVHENTDVGRTIAALLGLDLDAVTARLRHGAAVPAGR